MSQPFNSPERDVTPPHVALSRRRWLKLAGAGAAFAAGAGVLWYQFLRPGSDAEVLAPEQNAAPGNDLYPAALNKAFADPGRPLTDETEAARFTNFYEFSSGKAVWRWIEPFRAFPWQVEVAGLVAAHDDQLAADHGIALAVALALLILGFEDQAAVVEEADLVAHATFGL